MSPKTASSKVMVRPGAWQKQLGDAIAAFNKIRDEQRYQEQRKYTNVKSSDGRTLLILEE